jgi:hypothetical protein
VEDSVYVFYDTAFQYHLGPGNWQKEGDYMQYEFHSHNYTDAYNYDYVIDMGYYGKKGIVGPQRKKFKPGDYVGTSFMMSNIFDESCFLTYFGSPGTIYFRHFYDSLDVNGQMFYDVAHFQDTQNASENIYVAWYGSLNPQTDYFIAKNIGLIKIKITDQTQNNLINKSQSIIRYQIVQ